MNTTELLELERKGWEALATGRGAEFYGRVLTDDAIVVVPGMVLDRAQSLASWGASRRGGNTTWSTSGCCPSGPGRPWSRTR
jgi:hypothetical protein